MFVCSLQIGFPNSASMHCFHPWTPLLGNHGLSVVGGVLRSSSQEVCAYEAEVLEILHAMFFCHQFSLRNVLFEGDSMLVVRWVLRESPRPWHLHNSFPVIDYWMALIICIEVKHILMEANSVDDFLAIYGVEISERVWIHCT